METPHEFACHLAFLSCTDPGARTQIGTSIHAEQTQTFLCIPTGVQTSVRSCDDHTGKKTAKLNSMEMDNEDSEFQIALNCLLKHFDIVFELWTLQHKISKITVCREAPEELGTGGGNSL